MSTSVSALEAAVFEGKLSRVKQCLIRGAPVEKILRGDPFHGATFAHVAAVCRHSDVLDHLLALPKMRNSHRDSSGHTIAAYACMATEEANEYQADKPSCITICMDHHLDVTTPNRRKDTPLLLAIDAGHASIALKLLTHSQVKKRDHLVLIGSRGKSALDLARVKARDDRRMVRVVERLEDLLHISPSSRDGNKVPQSPPTRAAGRSPSPRRKLRSGVSKPRSSKAGLSSKHSTSHGSLHSYTSSESERYSPSSAGIVGRRSEAGLSRASNASHTEYGIGAAGAAAAAVVAASAYSSPDEAAGFEHRSIYTPSQRKRVSNGLPLTPKDAWETQPSIGVAAAAHDSLFHDLYPSTSLSTDLDFHPKDPVPSQKERSLTEQLDKERRRTTLLHAKVTDYQAQLRERDALLKDSQSKAAALERALEASEREAKRIESQVSDASAATAQEATRRIEGLMSELQLERTKADRISKENKALKKQCEDAEFTSRRLAQALATLEGKYQSNKDAYVTEKAATSKHIVELSTELSNANATVRTLNEGISGNQRYYDQLESDYKKSQETVSSLRARLLDTSGTDELKSEVTVMQRTIEELTAKLEAAQSDTREERERATALGAEVDDLKRRLSEETAESQQKLRDAEATRVAEVARLTEWVQDGTTSLEAAQRELAEEKGQVDHLTSELSGVKKEVEMLQSNEQATQLKLQDEVKDLKSQLVSAESDLAMQRADNSSLRNKLTDQASALDQYSVSTRQHAQEVSNLQRRVSDAEMAAEEAREEVRELQAAAARVGSQNAEAVSALEERVKLAEEAKRESGRVLEELREKVRALESSSRESALAAEEREEREEREESLCRECEELRGEVASLQRSLAEAAAQAESSKPEGLMVRREEVEQLKTKQHEMQKALERKCKIAENKLLAMEELLEERDQQLSDTETELLRCQRQLCDAPPKHL